MTETGPLLNLLSIACNVQCHLNYSMVAGWVSCGTPAGRCRGNGVQYGTECSIRETREYK